MTRKSLFEYKFFVRVQIGDVIIDRELQPYEIWRYPRAIIAEMVAERTEHGFLRA